MESGNHGNSDSTHGMGGDATQESVTDVSSLEMERSTTDKFEGQLYHVLPSAMKVTIQFVIPMLFNNFMGLLEKEFDTSCNVDDKFTVRSHIQGRNVTIKVFEARRTIEVSGPGHKLWRDITFKRIARNLFTRFIQNFSADFQSSINLTNDEPQMTSTPMVTRPVSTSLPTIPPVETSELQGSPVERQMIAILESLAHHSKMISSLQEQLTTLTTEVIKLQQQSSGSMITSKENSSDPNVRSRSLSVSSIESDSSCLLSTDPNQRQNVDIEQTPSLPRTSKQKKKQKKKHSHITQTNTTRSTPQQPKDVQTAEKTLIVGDSIIKGINPRGLKNTVHCNGISGATVDDLKDQISVYDLRNFSTIIIYVGGNNVSNGLNIEYVEEKYDQLLQLTPP